MRFSDPPGDWQSQTGAVRDADPYEPLENPIVIGGFDPRAVVRHSKHHVTGRPFEFGDDAPVSLSVANRIVEKVPHHLT